MTKRGGLGQKTRVAKIAELHRIRLREEKREPSPGRERFRLRAWVEPQVLRLVPGFFEI